MLIEIICSLVLPVYLARSFQFLSQEGLTFWPTHCSWLVAMTWQITPSANEITVMSPTEQVDTAHSKTGWKTSYTWLMSYTALLALIRPEICSAAVPKPFLTNAPLLHRFIFICWTSQTKMDEMCVFQAKIKDISKWTSQHVNPSLSSILKLASMLTKTSHLYI